MSLYLFGIAVSYLATGRPHGKLCKDSRPDTLGSADISNKHPDSHPQHVADSEKSLGDIVRTSVTTRPPFLMSVERFMFTLPHLGGPLAGIRKSRRAPTRLGCRQMPLTFLSLEHLVLDAGHPHRGGYHEARQAHALGAHHCIIGALLPPAPAGTSGLPSSCLFFYACRLAFAAYCPRIDALRVPDYAWFGPLSIDLSTVASRGDSLAFSMVPSHTSQLPSFVSSPDTAHGTRHTTTTKWVAFKGVNLNPSKAPACRARCPTRPGRRSPAAAATALVPVSSVDRASIALPLLDTYPRVNTCRHRTCSRRERCWELPWQEGKLPPLPHRG